MEILQFRGETGAYLEPAPGEPQINLLKMAREGLLAALRAAIAAGARRTMAPVATRAVRGRRRTAHARLCDLVVVPFTGLPDAKERLFVVLFEEAAAARGSGGAKRPRRRRTRRRTKGPAAIPELEHELAATKEYLQSLIEEHGRTNDELGSANEELVSGNEELQSMNEELETAKEELQSTNEELTTVNDELHSRNQEVSQVNSDLVNLLDTVDIPILILDIERRIRRFTPKARSILNVLPSDVGRPLDDIKLEHRRAPTWTRRSPRSSRRSRCRSRRSRIATGRWYRMQIRPYKTTENRIDGAILSLVDIDALKHHVARGPAGEGARRSGPTAPRTSSWPRSPTSCARRCPRC